MQASGVPPQGRAVDCSQRNVGIGDRRPVRGEVVVVVDYVRPRERRRVVEGVAAGLAQVGRPPPKGANRHDHVLARGEDGHVLRGASPNHGRGAESKAGAAPPPPPPARRCGRACRQTPPALGPRARRRCTPPPRILAAVVLGELVRAAHVDAQADAALRDPPAPEGRRPQLEGEARRREVAVGL